MCIYFWSRVQMIPDMIGYSHSIEWDSICDTNVLCVTWGQLFNISNGVFQERNTRLTCNVEYDLVVAPICSMAALLNTPLAGTGEASHLICIPGTSSSQNHDMSPQSVEWIAEYGTPMCHKVIIAWSNIVNFQSQAKECCLIHSSAPPLSIWFG